MRHPRSKNTCHERIFEPYLSTLYEEVIAIAIRRTKKQHLNSTVNNVVRKFVLVVVITIKIYNKLYTSIIYLGYDTSFQYDV
jgi:hypothetical protein